MMAAILNNATIYANYGNEPIAIGSEYSVISSHKELHPASSRVRGTTPRFRSNLFSLSLLRARLRRIVDYDRVLEVLLVPLFGVARDPNGNQIFERANLQQEFFVSQQ